MEQEIRGRFKDLPWFPQEETRVLVGGAGGIGSWTTFLLGRADFSPNVFDDDLIEAHNMGGQLYSSKYIGKYKVQSIADIVKDFSNKVINYSTDRIEPHSPTHKFCISGFDNMQAREDMFNSWVRAYSNSSEAIFIDGRLNAEQLQIFCITPDKAHRYRRDHLFSDSEVEEVACTAKQTSHMAAIIAGLITGYFTNHLTNLVMGEKIREVPNFVEYFLPMNLFTTENW